MAIRKVFSGKLLKFYTGETFLPDGRKIYLEKIKHPGASLIVPYYKGKIILITQFRAAINKYILELPAGIMEKGETPYNCAKRELEEETGFKAKRLKKIGYIYTSPGFCDEVIHVFKADCENSGKINLDDNELLKVKIMDKGRIKRLLKKGGITDSKTVSALALSGVI